MAEKKKNKKKKEMDIKERNAKPSNDEYAIAKYLKQKLPEKKTTLMGHKVEYMIASKAVDCLLESPWAKSNKKSEVHFTNRESAVEFMEKLLIHKFFHRAKKIVVQKESKKKKKDDESALECIKEKEKKKTKSDDSEKKDVVEVVEKKKERKKIKLDMHMEQIFIDSNEPYVWIYDPIPMRTWIIGTLMVVGAVLVCLFPLWPQSIRHYIYYLSVAAAFFLVFIIALAVLRYIVFVIIWLFTFGKHHLWLLPNLTEDVGFFESFWPLYKYEYRGSTEEHKKEEEEESVKDTVEDVTKDQEKSDSSSDQDRKAEPGHSESEPESDGERVKADNGFEFVEAEEVDDQDEEDNSEDRKTK